ncbi:NADPH-dependent F420 reductase [Curtobacterium sp. USHLN213]|uniref:NADPH-dependent F420 reductase n=1 Tax=Curtobacterium sp. USHLN213 TaxID=3081255 RepID=UPI0030161CAC
MPEAAQGPVAVLGTGKVARALAEKLTTAGNRVVLGSRDPRKTLAATSTNDRGTTPFAWWHDQHQQVELLPLPDAAAAGRVVINAVRGIQSLDTLSAAGAEHLADKPLLDASLPLDYTGGTPPTLTIANTDSLAEQIQRAFPATAVVKALTSVSYSLMIAPEHLIGPHDMFIAGNDPAAKTAVRQVLSALGWPSNWVTDLGPLSAARAIEVYSRLHYELARTLQTWDFNLRIVRSER